MFAIISPTMVWHDMSPKRATYPLMNEVMFACILTCDNYHRFYFNDAPNIVVVDEVKYINNH